MSALRVLAAVAALASLAGCAKPPSAYVVTPLHYETVKGKIDGQWFERTVNGTQGPDAVELLYCPSTPKQPVVCRTGVVWRYAHTDLIPQ